MEDIAMFKRNIRGELNIQIRGMKKVIDSPMKGELEHDFPILLKFVLENIKK